MRTAAGDLARVRALLDDLREDASRAAFDELLRSKAHLDEAEALFRAGSWEWIAATGTIHWSAGLHRIFGTDPQRDPTYEEYAARVHPADRPALLDAIGRTLSHQVPLEVEHRVVQTDGEVRWVRCHARVMADESGEAARLIGVCVDVSEQHAEREALRVAEQRFRLAFELAPIGMAMQTCDGRYLRANRHLCELLGRDEDQIVGFRFHDFTHPEDHRGDQEATELLVSGRVDVLEREKRYLRPDGSIVWAHCTESVIRHSDGDAMSFLILVRDIGAAPARRRPHAAGMRQGAASLREEVRRRIGSLARDGEPVAAIRISVGASDGAMGDRERELVRRRLEAQLRAGDVVHEDPDGGLVTVLSAGAGAATLATVAHRVHRVATDALQTPRGPAPPVSVGAAQASDAGVDAQALLQAAAHAVRTAAAAGGGVALAGDAVPAPDARVADLPHAVCRHCGALWLSPLSAAGGTAACLLCDGPLELRGQG